jgi:hypothetical protein
MNRQVRWISAFVRRSNYFCPMKTQCHADTEMTDYLDTPYLSVNQSPQRVSCDRTQEDVVMEYVSCSCGHSHLFISAFLSFFLSNPAITLHKPGIMALMYRSYTTLRRDNPLHYANCNTYNADF